MWRWTTQTRRWTSLCGFSPDPDSRYCTGDVKSGLTETLSTRNVLLVSRTNGSREGFLMCECGGSGTVEVFIFGLGLTDRECPDDDCLYWSGE